MLKLLPLYFAVPGLIYIGLILIIFIDSFIKVVKFWRQKRIKNNDLLFGLIISLVLNGILYLLYQGEKENLSRIFVGPFLLIFLPYFLHIVNRKSEKENYTYKLSVIVIVFSTLLAFLIRRASFLQ